MKEEEDLFSRWDFSKRIAQVISEREDSNSIVIGLYGSWGDGKTSVLNFIEKSLEDNDDVICIKFNPWRFGNEEVLLTGLFHDIASALGKKIVYARDTIKDLVNNMAPAASAIHPIAGAVGTTVSGFISSVDIEELKKRIEKELCEEQKKRVLVLIDDVDRLEKSEIHALFRLVKLTANFKNIAYILAFDKDIVAASLQDRYPNSSGNAGEAFLEKIIQVPLHLPSIEKETLKEFCFKGVEEALSIAKISLTEQQKQEFRRDFIRAFNNSLTTPRQAKLYGNTLLFSLPILKGEVNPVDLMLIEGIRVFCPPLYDTIRQNKDVFLRRRRRRAHSDFNNSEEKKVLERVVEEALSSAENINKPDFLSLLCTLFPQLELVYDESSEELVYDDNVSFSRPEKWDKDQRICSENYFSRYFMHSIPEGDISNQAITSIIKKAENWKAPFDEKDNPLNGYLTSKNAELLLQKFISRSKEISPDGSKSLMIAVARIKTSSPNPARPIDDWFDPLFQAAMQIGMLIGELIRELIQNLAIDDKEEWACRSIRECSDIDVKLWIFRWLRRKNKLEREGFSQETVQRIGKSLSQEIISELDSKSDITSSISDEVFGIFDTLDTYYEKGYSAEYFEKAAKKDPSIVSRVLHSAAPTTSGKFGIGIRHKYTFERKQYDEVARVLDLSFIMKLIEKHYPEAVEELEEFPENEDGHTDEALCLKQFVCVHRYVLKEKSSDKETNEEK